MNDQLAADLGNKQAWDRYHRAQAEVNALRALCAELVDHFGEDFLPMNDPESWPYRLRKAAAGMPLGERTHHERP